MRCRRAIVSAGVLLLPLCGVTAAVPPADLAGSAPGAGSGGFQQALAPRPFTFPLDHGPHEGFRHEWWYFTGNLDAVTGERFGFELTFFRFALAPPSTPAAARSAWRTREVYMAHFAITDVARRRFAFQQKFARAAQGLAGAQADPLAVWLDAWQVRELSRALGSRAAPVWTLQAAQPGYSVQLSLQPCGPPVLNGEAGLSRKSSEPGAASYYYSIPRMAVSGTLRRDGVALAVHGLAWFDREWGSSTLASVQSGWDWFALQLGDGTAVMFYALRNRDGSRAPLSAGTWIDAQGGAHPLADSDVSIEVLDHWSNAHGLRYPARWRVRVASLRLDLEVNPVLADQELSTAPPYWEGAVDVRGVRAGGPVRGRGYVELVGYGSGAAGARTP